MRASRRDMQSKSAAVQRRTAWYCKISDSKGLELQSVVRSILRILFATRCTAFDQRTRRVATIVRPMSAQAGEVVCGGTQPRSMRGSCQMRCAPCVLSKITEKHALSSSLDR